MKKIISLLLLQVFFTSVAQAQIEIRNPRYFYDQDFLKQARSLTDPIQIGRWVDYGGGAELDFDKYWLNAFYEIEDIKIFEIGDEAANSDLCLDVDKKMWCVSDLFFGYVYPPVSFFDPDFNGTDFTFKAISGFDKNKNYTIFETSESGSDLSVIKVVGSGLLLERRDELIQNYPLARKNVEKLNNIISPFIDLSLNHPLYKKVLQAVEEGWISGYPDGTIKLENTVNRAEFAKMLTLAFGKSENPDEGLITKFPDLEKNAWYRVFLAKAVELGVMSGYPDGTMKPAQTINAAEASKMVLEIAGTDISETEVWYEGYRQELLKLEEPPSYITNGEMDYLITRGDAIDLILKVKDRHK